MSSRYSKILCVSLVLCAGCHVTEEAERQTEPAEDAKESGAFFAYPPEPIHFDGRTSPFGKELLYDTEFVEINVSEAEEGQPLLNVWGIEAFPGSSGLVSKVSDGQDEEDFILEIASPPLELILSQRTSAVDRISPGAWLVATARCRASAADELGLALVFLMNDRTIRVVEGHPGDGQWRDLQVAVPLPVGADPGSFTIELVRRASSSTPVQVDNASLRMVPDYQMARTDVKDGAIEYLLNGDFEHYAFLGMPYPWRASVEVEAKKTPASTNTGGTAALFGRLSQRIRVNVGKARVQYQTESGGESHALNIARVQRGALAVVTPEFVPMLPRHGWIDASVRGKASAPGELALVVSFDVNRELVELPEFHPGDGEWHTLRVLLPYPRISTSPSLAYRIVRYSNSNEPVLIDDASLRWYRHHPDAEEEADAWGEELLINGDFEHFFISEGLPAPWELYRWGEFPSNAVLADAASENSGKYIVELTPGEVGIRQQIYGLTEADKGVTLLAKATGMSNGDGLYIGMRFFRNGRLMENYSTIALNPSDGQWHTWQTECTLPADELPDRVNVHVWRGRRYNKPVFVDNVTVTRIRRE